MGPETVARLNVLRPDIALLGANGIHATFGLSTPDSMEASVKRAPAGHGIGHHPGQETIFSGRRENGKVAWFLGGAFIPKGAISFAAADPLRVIPAGMRGAAVTAAMVMVMATGVTSQAPHGGLVVFFAIGNFGMFVLSIIVGTVVSALAVIALKRYASRQPVAVPATEKSKNPTKVL